MVRRVAAFVTGLALLVTAMVVVKIRVEAEARTAVVVPKSAAIPSPSTNVHVFYYPWYGNPAGHGSYLHWDQGGHLPPLDIGANLYPTLGAYDSGDVGDDRPAHDVDRAGRCRGPRLQLVGTGLARGHRGGPRPRIGQPARHQGRLAPRAVHRPHRRLDRGRHQLHHLPPRIEPGVLPRRGSRQPAGVLRLRKPAYRRLGGAGAGPVERLRPGADHRSVEGGAFRRHLHL